MRLFLLLIIFSTTAFAQLDVGSNTTSDCLDIDFKTITPPPNNIFECKDVIITNLSTSDFFDPTSPLVIKATGTVTIGTINFSGQPGTDDGNGLTATGGPAGLGGGAGGSFFFGGNDGLPASHAGKTGSPSICGAGQAEGSGGSGGSLETPGEAGYDGAFADPGEMIGAAGAPGSTITIDPMNFLVAGSGGGTGGKGCNPADLVAGAGGGGGGGIQIISAGNVSVTGTVNVSGGNGGVAPNFSGGGGGGSGGVIIIQTLGQITINTLNAAHGTGGANSTITNSGGDPDGDGGNGAPGKIILEDWDGTVTGTFDPTITEINRLGPIPKVNSLNSDISCGTLTKTNEEHNQIFQIAVGFLFAMMFGLMIKILSRCPMRS